MNELVWLRQEVARLSRELGEARAAQPEALLTSAQVADLAAVSVRTMWRMVAAGQLPQPVRYNRKLVRWRRAEVVAFLSGGKDGAT